MKQDAVPALAQAPNHAVHVDLDERSFLFPTGKNLTRMIFSATGRTVHVDVVFAYNQTKTSPRLISLDVDDARQLGRMMVESTFLARTQHAISETMRISLDVMPNGYRWHIGDINNGTELYLGASCVWRVCQGLLRVVDAISPVEAH